MSRKLLCAAAVMLQPACSFAFDPVPAIDSMGNLLKYGELGLFLADLLLVAGLIYVLMSKGRELAPATAAAVERILYVFIGATVLVVLMSFIKDSMGPRVHPVSIVLAPSDVEDRLLPAIRMDGDLVKPDSSRSIHRTIGSKTEFAIDFTMLDRNLRDTLALLNSLKSKANGKGAQDDPT